jgi:hypothetical protein
VTASLLSVAALMGIKMMRLQMKVAKTTAIRFEVSYIMEEMVDMLQLVQRTTLLLLF